MRARVCAREKEDREREEEEGVEDREDGGTEWVVSYETTIEGQKKHNICKADTARVHDVLKKKRD